MRLFLLLTFLILSCSNPISQEPKEQPDEVVVFLDKVAPKYEHKEHYIKAVKEASAKFNIPPKLLIAVTQVECSFQHNLVSSENARGLFQIIPYVAKHYAGKIGLKYYDGIEFSTYEAAMISAAILADLHAEYVALGWEGEDDYSFTLLAYNNGPTAVKRKKLKPEKSSYVKKVNKVLAMR